MKCGIMTRDMRVCGLTNPLGIGTKTPDFRWKLESLRREQKQSAYRILVADDREKLNQNSGNLWDSGVVVSRESFGILYEGTELASSQCGYWKLMVWDQDGNPSDWSEEQYFETALLEPSDWLGRWISAPKPPRPLEGLWWIGYGDDTLSTVTFTKSFTIPEGAEAYEAWFDGTVDARFTLTVNGSTVAKSNPEWGQDYTSPFTWIDFADKLHPGENCIVCEACRDGGVPVFIGLFRILLDSGESMVFSTDESWLAGDAQSMKKAKLAELYGEGEHGTPVRHGIVPLLRKEFMVAGPVASARLYFCGLGYGELTINGQKPQDSLLTTPYTEFSKRALYSTCDVTKLLSRGVNCLGAELGRGYYSCFRDWIGLSNWCGEPKLLLQLRITYEDGTVETVVSDESWKTADGATLDDNIWYGEVYDARREIPGWTMPGCDESGWKNALPASAPGGALEASVVPPIRVCERFSCAEVGRPKPGIIIYDAGKITAGRVVITVHEPKSARVKVTCGEYLREDGVLDIWKDGCDFQFWQTPQVDCYISAGRSEESWAPKFSYYGFRYIQVEGLHGSCEVTAEVFHNEVARLSEFRCSNPMLEKIHKLCADTVLNNLHSIPTDTPMHEKRGWTGDGQVIANCACRNYDMQNFFAKWTQDIEDSQSEQGAISHTCPGPKDYPPTPAWMSALILVPWSLYQSYGDKAVFSRHYEAFKKYLAYELNRLEGNVSSDRYYGDWCVPGANKGPEDSALFATVYVYRACDLMAQIARILGKAEDEVYYRDWADRIRDTVNSEFLSRVTDSYHSRVEVGYRQSLNVLPLAFGIVPEDRAQAIAAALQQDVAQTNKNHLTTGCFGTQFLAPVLTEYGYRETAYALADQRTYPSWGYWVEQGATACLEGWGFDSRSYDHYFLGTIDDWFFEYLVGIRPLEPGYRKVEVRPFPPEAVSFAEGKLETISGTVRAAWRKTPGRFELQLDIPANTTAFAHLPEGAEVLESGVPAEQAEGVASVRREEGGFVCVLGSGTYCLTVIQTEG